MINIGLADEPITPMLVERLIEPVVEVIVLAVLVIPPVPPTAITIAPLLGLLKLLPIAKLPPFGLSNVRL